jgi:hypothetical protein
VSEGFKHHLILGGRRRPKVIERLHRQTAISNDHL